MEFLQSHHSTNIAESGYTLGTGLCSAVNALDLLGTEESLTTSINRHQHHQTNDNGTIGPSGNTGVTIGNIQELQSSPTDDINQETEQPIHNNNQPQVIGEFGASFWVDDMAGFPLPPLDLDPLPPGLFSPCSASYNWGCTRSDCVTRPGNPNGEGVADVLLSLKHAVVHPASPTGSYYNCSPAANHHYPQEYTQNIGPLPVGQTNFTTGPAMSVNVSMNMTMNMHPSYEVNYASAWGVEPLLSPAPQYNPIQDSQTRMNQTSANSLISSHPPVLHPHNRLQPSIDDEHALCTSVNNNNNNNTTQSIIQDDNGRPNLCRICGKTYARPSTLKTHLRTHSGEKPFRCHACSKAFSQAANLTAHARTHSGEKPFRCPVCDRRFSQSSSVTTHMRTHSGERPYRCRFCKKAFSDSSTLTKHLRIHSGEKPYQCKLCLLRFSQSGNLNRHMRVHGVSLT